MGALAANTQGVHDKEITEQNHFIVSKLVKSYSKDNDVLLAASTPYNQDVKNLQFSATELALLGLTDKGKRVTLDKVLAANKALPNDEEFVEMVTKKVSEVLKGKYLDPNSGYYTHKNAYDEQGGNITIPETIGLVYQLINNSKFPIAEKRGLLATLIEKNPDLVERNLGLLQEKLGENITADQLKKVSRKLLADNGDTITKELFSKISSGLEIDEVLKKRKSFELAESLYWAATTMDKIITLV
ncbi:MAG: hypothetical protein RCG15_03585 [Candidatus Rickettsia vulgarisii]